MSVPLSVVGIDIEVLGQKNIIRALVEFDVCLRLLMIKLSPTL